MRNSEGQIFEPGVGRVPARRVLAFENAVSEAERRICRAHEIISRQRELVARLGDRMPVAAMLLENFEKSAALLEQALASYRRNEAVMAVAAASLQQDNQQQMRDIARIMEVLRQGGFQCGLRNETLH